tara:strand:- start:41 stop:319 length:279 start_codon:yes stop_codon:yes gene_type:complete
MGRKEITSTSKLDKMVNLQITGQDLNTGTTIEYNIKGSNIFTVLPKYLEVIEDLNVENYTLTTQSCEGGNRGMNAGAYLNEYMEELTGFDLS